MNKNPLVSLITPGWNGAGFVQNSLNSILAQTYRPIEYIYVDDGSTDGTKDIVLGYKTIFEEQDFTFKYIYKENGGVSSAINEGLKYVTGKYLGWPEYDDILTPDSIEKRVQYLEEHEDCAVVTCDAWMVHENAIDKPFGHLSYKNPNRFDRNHFVQALLTNSIFTAACHLVRMDIFDETHQNRKIYPSRIGPNWQMLLPMYFKHNRGFIDESLVYYVVRGNSISHSHNTLDKRVSAIDEYIKILQHVLEEIPMHPKDRFLYSRLVANHYAYEWCKLGFEYKNKEIFNRGYDYLVDNGINIEENIKKQRAILYETPYQTKKRLIKSRILDSALRLFRC